MGRYAYPNATELLITADAGGRHGYPHEAREGRVRPLLSVQPVGSLVANTTTSTGLKIKAALDTRSYDTEVEVSDEEFAAINLRPSRFHGDWNYVVG